MTTEPDKPKLSIAICLTLQAIVSEPVLFFGLKMFEANFSQQTSANVHFQVLF